MMDRSTQSVRSEIYISPVWVIGPLAALITPTIFAIEILSGALEPRLVLLFFLSYLVLGVASLLIKLRSWAGEWFLIIAFFGMIWLAQSWWDMPQLLTLMVIPPLLATVLIGWAAALLTTIGETVFLLTWSSLMVTSISPTTKVIVLVTIWVVLTLVFAIHHRAHQLSEWSWNYYRQGQVLLEEALDRKVELEQALSDLSEANRQLTRLNALAHGLRRVAEEANKAKEDFVARVSHELRTPLNMIIGYTEVILQSPEIYGANLPEALLADLSVIFRNAEHLSALVDDILDLTEIETGQIALTKEEVYLLEIVKEATIAVRPLFDSKRLYLEVEVPAELPPLFCDRTRIREVLLNLLSNAGRFTEHGGVRVRAWQQGQDLIVAVTDTGPGIAAEDMARLFQPFQQLSPSVRKRYGGSGLGLSISKRFVELHNGDIWVESVPGVGTTFYLRLPIVLPMPTEGELVRWLRPDWEYRQRTRPSLAPKVAARDRFLILDERGVLARLLTRYLADAEVISVPHLDQAVHEILDNPGTALVINAASPEEALQWLRCVERYKLPEGIPVIICAVPNPIEHDDIPCVCDRLTKPIRRDCLLAALDRLGHPVSTILVIHDQPDVLQFYRRVLASWMQNCQVMQARDVEEATKVARQRRPDVALLDMDWAEGDSLQLIRTWDSNPDTSAIPIVAISANHQRARPALSNFLVITKGEQLSTQEVLTFINWSAKHLSRLG